MNSFSGTFQGIFFENAKKQTRATQFLEEMEGVIMWDKFLKRVDKHYYNTKSNYGRKKFPSKTMLKIYFLQQWYNLSDPGVEDAIYDRFSFQKFLGVDISKKGSVPDETTILNFRHFLEKHNLQERLFEMVVKMMKNKGFILNEGTSVDASLIKAPSSTKNKEKKRDPEMSSTKKNGSYHFGMKIHIGSDHRSGMVHSFHGTTAKLHDIKGMSKLLHGKERAVFGDKGYKSQEYKKQCRKSGIYYGILDQQTRRKKLSIKQLKQNKQKTDVRKKVEFNFGIVKHLWGHTKVRYRGLEKNNKQFFALFALSNLYKYNQFLKKTVL